MPEMDLIHIAAWGAAFALTLLLAAWLTPRAWWRRPNLRALGVLAGGTLAFGLLFSAWLPATAVTPLGAAALVVSDAHGAQPAPGGRYLVVDDLNLRDAHGVRAQRTAVLRAGTLVTATGAADGDWWQVRARVDGQAREGWASSLWLRRADERRPQDAQAGTKRIGL
jgi:hypothetical protein